MKHQILFSSKDKSKRKKIKVSPAAILLGSLRVKGFLKENRTHSKAGS